jgi:nitrogen fixation NifU-like protein
MNEEIFREILIEHSQHPRCHGQLEQATHQASGDNPLCGDKIDVDLQIDADGVIEAVAIRCVGCAISTASASLMAERLTGMTRHQAQELFTRVHALVTGRDQQDVGELGEIAALRAVNRYPMRVKCATLAWHTLKQALEPNGETVTTE